MGALARKPVPRLATLLAAVFVGLALPAPPAAADPVCDTSWLGGSGSWGLAANWSNGLPDSTKRACITAAGTYTVTVSGTQTALGLTLGAASGTQTVDLAGSEASGIARLNLTNQGDGSDGIGAGGRLHLTSTNAAAHAILDVQAGTLTNAGTIEVQPRTGSTDPQFLGGDVTSAGTILINGSLDTFGDTDITTSGTFTVAAGRRFLTASGCCPYAHSFTQTGGTITNNGTFRVADGGIATFSAGTASGNPLEMVGADVRPSGTGTATLLTSRFAILGSDVAEGYTLLLRGQATTGEGGLRVLQSRTNNGTMRLDSAVDVASVLSVEAGVLTNLGTLETQPRPGSLSPQFIGGDIDNQATVTISGNTETFGSSDWTQTDGTLSVTSGAALRITSGCCPYAHTFTQLGGTVANDGTFRVTEGGIATFVSGMATGNPLEMVGADVRPSGTGTATLLTSRFAILGSDVAEGYTLLLRAQPTTGEGGLRVLEDRTNNGTVLVHSPGEAAATVLNVEAGVLTNMGTFTVLARDSSGTEFMGGDIDNRGTLTIAGNVNTFGDSDWMQTSGTLTVDGGGTLVIGSGCCPYAHSLTQAGGTITNNARFEVATGGIATFDAGTAGGNPIDLVNTEIHLSGTGSGTFIPSSSSVLSSDVGAGYTLLLRGKPATGFGHLRVLADRTNDGTIRLDGLEAGQFGLLEIEGATLTNAGTIATRPRADGDTGPQFIRGDLANTGTLDLTGNTQTNSGSDWTTSGAVTVAADVGGTLNYTQTAGSTTLTGRLLAGEVDLQGGVLTGTGTVEGNLGNAAEVAPGASAGTLAVTGTYTQTATGTLSTEVTASGHDRLNVSGAATLAGTLAITTSGPPRTVGETFPIVAAGSRSGQFGTVTGTGSGPYDVQYASNGVTLAVVDAGAFPTVSIDDVAVLEGHAGTTTATFAVELSEALPHAVSVRYDTANGSAQAPSDYETAGGIVTLPAGDTSEPVSVTVNGDTTPERDETVVVNLTAPEGAAIADGRGVGTILNDELALAQVTPVAGGDSGPVELTAHGAGFNQDATVRLTRAGQADLVATGVAVADDARSLSAVVDLSGRARGVWDVVVTNPDGRGSGTLAGAFSVEEPRAADVWVKVVGPHRVRTNRPWVGLLTFGNNGNVDAQGVQIRMGGMPAHTQVRLPQQEVVASVMETGRGRVISVFVPRVGAGTTRSIPISFTPDQDGVTDFDAWIAQPTFGAEATEPPITVGDDAEAEILEQTASRRRGVIHLDGPSGGGDIAFDITVTDVPDFTDPSLAIVESGDQVEYRFRGTIKGSTKEFEIKMEAPPSLFARLKKIGKLVGDLKDGAESYSLSLTRKQVTDCLRQKGIITDTQHADLIRYAEGAFTVKLAAKVVKNVTPGIDPFSKSLELITTVTDGAWEGALGGNISNSAGILGSSGDDRFLVNNSQERLQVALELCSDEASTDTDSAETTSLSSMDPNDKIGPAGSGAGRFTDASEPFVYAIHFENLETATAAAQEVRITDQLDVSKFELETFTLGTIVVGDRVVTPPAGLSAWTTDVDLRPDNDLILRIEAGLEAGTGVVTWRFSSLDPATMEPTTDVDAGFLPPNDTAPEGQGSVMYSLRAEDALATGTQIANGARIVFDDNPFIDTPVWTNTIDRETPTSTVETIGQTDCSTDLAVAWSGSDAGSGVQDYTVFVSEDGGPFELWRYRTAATGATYSAETGKTYSFYSVARDGAGRVEAVPAAGDATHTVTCATPTPTPSPSASPSASPTATASPSPSATPGPGIQPDTTPRLVTIGRASLSGGTLAARITCPPTELEPCSGSLKATARKLRLGTKAFALAPGRTGTVAIKLSKRARRALAKKSRVKIALVATTRDRAGNRGTTRRTVRIRLPRR